MTSFTGISQYAPSLVLLVGLAWLAGLWGLGRAILAISGFRLPSPWAGVTAVLLGIQAVSLAVQLLGMMELSSHQALVAIWGFMTASGVMCLALAVRQVRLPWTASSTLSLSLLAVVAIAVTANLLVAVAPSTKIDEIYYHMLVPSRIVTDGALHFYRAPWVAAIWPQMVYEISSTPLHAIGYPDAPNVVSWGLGVLLLGFAWRFVQLHGVPPALAAILLGALCVGLYSTVWYGNGGAHAMGDLAMVTAIVSFVDRQHLVDTVGRVRFAGMISLILVCAATSKVSLLPICTVMVFLNAWLSLRDVSWRESVPVLLAFASPWILFYLPIMVWSWVQSGSPFGPMMAGAFGPSVYDLEKIRAILRHARDGFQPSLTDFLFSTGVNYSPLVWFGLLGIAVGVDLPRSMRIWLGALFFLQCALIFFLLPHDVRFTGGMHLGILVVAVAFCGAGTRNRFENSRAVLTACILCLVPWLAAQLYYARSFVPVALGLERGAFYQRLVAYFDDYVALDKLLPRDAVLLAVEGHTSAVYAPRPIFFHPLDLPVGKRPFYFRDAAYQSPVSLMGDVYRLGALIYYNNESKAVVFRTGRHPRHIRLEIIELRK